MGVSLSYSNCQSVPAVSFKDFALTQQGFCMDISASTADVMHDCDVLNPPEMPSIDITFLSKEITSFDLIGGDQYGGVSVDIGMWVGFEKVSANGDYCVWLGQPDAKGLREEVWLQCKRGARSSNDKRIG